MDKFEQMVEAIEEAEDMVECKECFDLFPKADCTKMDHGYLCPTCGQGLSHDMSDVSFTDITTDLYDQEFPDVMEYDSEFKNQVDEKRPDYDIDTMVDILVKDEFDAIDSYEVAEEVLQHAEGDDGIKDDLLDAIEHIKEEEEEHIDELNKAAGRVEEDPEDKDDEDDKDDKKDESDEDSDSKDEDDDKEDKEDSKDEVKENLTEDVPAPEMVEGEEILDEKKEESVFDKIWKPVNESLWVCRFKDQEIGTVEAESEEEALEKMQQEYPEYNYGEYDGCFEVCQEADCKKHDAINHSEDDKAILNEVFGGDKVVDNLLKAGYLVKVMAQRGYPAPEAKYAKAFPAKSYKDAEKLAKQLSKTWKAGYAVCIFAAPLDDAIIKDLDPTIKELVAQQPGSKIGPQLAMFVGGKEEVKYNKITELTKQLKVVSKTDKKIAKLTDKNIELENDPETDEAADDTPTEVSAKADDAKADAAPVEDAPAGEASKDTADTVPAKEEPKESSKKTAANQKIKAALKNAGMSTADIDKLFKNGTLPTIRKALIGEGLTLEDLENEDTEDIVECV